MTTEQINRVIHEAMGKEWPKVESEEFHCKTCGTQRWITYVPDYTSWVDYGEALKWAKGQKWWDECVYEQIWSGDSTWLEFDEDLLNPLTGSPIFAEFIVANPQYFGRKG